MTLDTTFICQKLLNLFFAFPFSGKLEICQMICKNNAYQMTKNKSGWTPMHLSAQNGHLKVTKFFLETYDDKNPKSKSGITPLHNAAREGHVQVCKLILECGLKEKNPSEVDGKTP